MISKKIKIFISIILCIAIFDTTYAVNPLKGLTTEDVTIAKDFAFSQVYPRFLRAVAKQESFFDAHKSGRASFYPTNKKLIIGCSPVVYMSCYAQQTVDAYKYDLVGFGSTVDAQMLSWLKTIDKKYNKIVIWGAANDLLNAVFYHTNLDMTYFETLNELLGEARRHLDNSPMAKIIYVNVKPIDPELDDFPPEEAKAYNEMAYQINMHVKNLGIQSVDVTALTNQSNSEWYIHFYNSDVFKKILNDIEAIDG